MDIFHPPPRWRSADFDETKLTSEERRVLGLLKFHVGGQRAIKIDWIANSLKIPERRVRDILKHLTETHGLAIASLVQPPYGIYLIEAVEELENYCKQLHGRALSALRREAVLKKRRLPELLGQMALEVRSGE